MELAELLVGCGLFTNGFGLLTHGDAVTRRVALVDCSIIEPDLAGGASPRIWEWQNTCCSNRPGCGINVAVTYVERVVAPASYLGDAAFPMDLSF